MGTVTQPINLLFEKAGTIMLRARTSSGPLSTLPEDTYIANSPIVKSISASMSKEMYDIETGNSMYPADKRPKKVTGKVSVKLNSFDRQLHRFATGATLVETSTGAVFPIVGAEYVVPTATQAIVLPYTVDSIIAIKVYETGEALTVTENTVATGQYSFETAENLLTFFSDMTGKKIVISYNAKASKTSSDVISSTPVDRTYEVTIMGEATTLKGAAGSQFSAIVFDSLKFEGEIKPPERTNQAGDWDISLEMVEPYGTKPVEFKYVEKTDLTVFS